MFKTRVYILIIVFIGSCFFILSLKLLAHQIRQSPNGFFRDLPSHKIFGLNIRDLKRTDLYIAGRNGNDVYVGSRYFKNFLYKINLKTLDTSSLLITAPDSLKVYPDAQLIVDSSTMFLMDGSKAQISIGSVYNHFLTTSISTSSFISCIPLSPNSFLFRSVNANNQNILVKQQISNKSVIVRDDILKKQIDGFFCTDGILLDVPNSNKICYIYYYRNQFIVADTNLNPIYTGKTIDTNYYAKIKVGTIHSSGEKTIASPPAYVNRQACANQGHLFIHSMLRSNNETEDMHESNAAIDVYALQNGKYEFSFYIPDLEGNKMTDFKVYDNTMLVLYGKYIYTFKLNF